MSNSEPQRQIHLAAGDFYFGQGDLSLRTVLGSCITITLWHSNLRIGGMSHCLLPEFPSAGDDRTTLYVEGAVQQFSHHLLRLGAAPGECVVKLLGGGNMFPQQAMEIGQRNIDAARRMLQKAGFTISGEHVGGNGHRVVIFDLTSGNTWLRAPNAVSMGSDS
ncbi:MAG: chemotaxis protein CheD [Methylococcaceae bacterium]|nr:MAG: chemotaxis protein CheD [Methylococcaceae bacterium]